MKRLGIRVWVLAGLAALASAGVVDAQAVPPPHATPLPPAVPAPRDVGFDGVVQIAVDATDVRRGVFQVRETIPAEPGEMVLLYPKWLPGTHGPEGRIEQLAGLTVHAGRQRLEWRRDPVDMFAFHVDIPAGVSSVQLDYQYLSPVRTQDGRIVTAPSALDLQWTAVVVYPAGWYARRIPVEATLTLPDGWRYATALDAAPDQGATVRFRQTDLETLVDSPVFAGKYFRRIELSPATAAPVGLDLFADTPEALAVPPQAIEAHKALIVQADRLFGSRNYHRYEFLIGLSDRLSSVNLEHETSSEDIFDADFFTNWRGSTVAHDLTAHEYVHSWNGKFRRPADLWTPEFDTPMRGSLLWVYEGLTNYWDNVLSARSGLWSRQETLDAMAALFAGYDSNPGRAWRSLEDVGATPAIAPRSLPWRSWQRSIDFYVEGELIWLDADTLIRERSHGKRSLDDFARAFYGRNDGRATTITYTFEDLVQALNAIEPYDWAGFFRARLDGHGLGAPLDGLRRGGYHIAFAETPSAFVQTYEAASGTSDLRHSIGVMINRSGLLNEVLWDGPAYRAGLVPGAVVTQVSGVEFSLDRLKAAIAATKHGADPIRVTAKIGPDTYEMTVDYHDGLRFPHMERIDRSRHWLDDILAPKN